mmetsp:Transcript_49887/g.97841  ORF Transcript_49887/g.97841 Transcript_49887/m.97841 type:complete len:1226 (-) Transcript_49887:256-3933(-)|eukprot:CAMPEP_0175132086 /NCGR_PEP_ID=MMETSP0087-20121206/6890_1 /TAXON_ID=136419 /ORGANISM="Unknown Unknown, Strain D1" /LENGTH=1225 /DNA_ID=CAMNT_0016414423 /DNA_START=28 /DNA_END=3705 /DNA_ORIENTATION=-
MKRRKTEELESEDEEDFVCHMGSSPSHDGNIIRKLAFATKDCQTPGRYNPRQKLGQPVQVFLRVRPVEGLVGAGECINIVDDSSVEVNAPSNSLAIKHGEKWAKYTFSKVFRPHAEQKDVYEHTTSPLVSSMFDGENGLVFAYGMTNSGKTHTIQGAPETPGIVPRALVDLFRRLEDNEEYKVVLSYLEIYNEKIYDLLDESRKCCQLRNSKKDQVFVVGIKEMSVTTLEESMAIMRAGQNNRQVTETILNSDSSRSHSVFTIKLVNSTGEVWSRLSICDLAGSERTKRTEHTGQHLRETSNINTSLMKLGRCLEILRFNQLQTNPARHKIVPFRESQITRMFRDSLCGWGRTVMITNANPNPDDFDETVHALKYAAIAKEIRCEAKVDSWRPTVATHTLNGKRVADTSVQELEAHGSEDELEEVVLSAGGDGSGGGEFDSAIEQELDAHLDTIYQLKKQLVDATGKLAETETRVREEVCAEMEEQAIAIEETWMERMEMQKANLVRKYEGKLSLLQKNMQELQQQHLLDTSSPSVSSSSSSSSEETSRMVLHEARAEFQRTVDQLVKSHQAEVSHLSAEHKREVSSLANTAAELQKSLDAAESARSDNTRLLSNFSADDENSTVLSTLGTLENKMNELSKRAVEASAKKPSMAMKRLESTNAKLEATNSKLAAKAKKAEEQVKELKKELKEKNNRISELVTTDQKYNALLDTKAKADKADTKAQKEHQKALEDSTKALADLQKEMQTLTKQHDALGKTSDIAAKQSQKDIQKLEKELEDSQNTVTQLQRDLKDALKQSSNLTKAEKERTKKSAKETKKLEKLEQDTSKKLEQEKTKRVELEQEVEQLTSELAKAKDTMNKEIDRLNKETDKLAKESEKASRKFDKLEQEKAKKLEQEVAKRVGLEQEVEKLTADLAQQTEAATKQPKKDSKLKDLEKEKKKLETTIKKLEKVSKEQSEKIEKEKAATAELQKEVKSLTKSLADSEINKNHSTELRKTEKENEELKKLLETTAEDLALKEGALAEATNLLSKEKAKRLELEGEHDELTTEQQKLNSRLEKLLADQTSAKRSQNSVKKDRKSRSSDDISVADLDEEPVLISFGAHDPYSNSPSVPNFSGKPLTTSFSDVPKKPASKKSARMVKKSSKSVAEKKKRGPFSEKSDNATTKDVEDPFAVPKAPSNFVQKITSGKRTKTGRATKTSYNDENVEQAMQTPVMARKTRSSRR